MAVEWIETRDVPLAELTRYPGNAKRGDVSAIRESIRRTGQYRSIVVRLDGDAKTILAGNHTFDAVSAEGAETVRAELVRCSDDEAVRINLADNRTSDLGNYDDEALIKLLSDLGDDFEGTGYTEDFFVNLIDDSLEGAAEVGERSAPEEFPSFDVDLKTDYQCPKCSYEWSGKPR